jgi:nucleoside-diphosphate-sugar epimerase
MAQRVCVTGAGGQAGRAVVHLANIPAPGLSTPAVTFNSNITMNFNVFQAAAALKLSRVGWASSETTLGLPFDTPPRYAPVDEDHYPVPTSTYALSKVASETVAGHIADWSGIPFLAEVFPGVKLTRDVGEFGTLLAIDRAREVLGFAPAHSWRDHVQP